MRDCRLREVSETDFMTKHVRGSNQKPRSVEAVTVSTLLRVYHASNQRGTGRHGMMS